MNINKLIDEKFNAWFKELYPEADSVEMPEYNYEDLREAFAEGYEVAKDEIEDIIQYWINATTDGTEETKEQEIKE